MGSTYSLNHVESLQNISDYCQHIFRKYAGKPMFAFVVVAFMLTNGLNAQTSNYNFTASSGTFVPITGTTMPLSGGSIDEGFFNDIPIGFTFRYWNADYTTISASTNGWITFGQSLADAAYLNNLTDGGTRPLAAPLWDDLKMVIQSDFSYTTTGTAPNRVFTAQWLNMKWDYHAANPVISFQLKLYEADGKIEYVYDQKTGVLVNGSGGGSIGLAGPGTGPENFLSLSGTDPLAVASSTVETTSLNNRPFSGQVFSFVPVTVAVSSPSQVPAGNIMLGSTNSLLSAFQVTASNGNAVLNNLTFSTTGTCTTSDLINLKLFYSSTNTFPGGTPVSTISTYSGSGSYTFSGLTQVINNTGYFWIASDVRPTAVVGRTVTVAANPVLTFPVGTPTGVIAAGGTRTVAGAVVQVTSPNPAIPAAPIVQNTLDNVIYRFDIGVSLANVTLTGIRFTTSGTYSLTDIQSLKVWYSSDATFSLSDVNLSKITSNLGPGTQSVSLSRIITANTTGYFFITADLDCSSTSNATISVSPVTASDLTFSSGTKSGSAFAGGTQTIQDATPFNVTGASSSVNLNTSVISWTNPAPCFDEVMIVGKSGASITGVPTGNGSAYSANLAFGSGTAFDGGFVIYKGSASPQTVTGLSLGNTYYFKLFSRKGSTWSPGVEISTTTSAPSSGEYRSVTTGNWTALNTWQLFNGTSWVTPNAGQGTPTTASGKITICNGHTVTVDAKISADQITVDAGGVINTGKDILTIANGADTIDCIVNGTIVNSGEVIASGVLSFNNGAVYEHAQNGGNIPAAKWNNGSTCNITGVGGSYPTGMNQTFYNFTWNCLSQNRDIVANGGPLKVTGTFSLVATGTKSFFCPGGDATYANYLQTNGIFSIVGGGTTGTINVSNFTLQGGTLNMSDANNATGTLNVSGNFNLLSGTIWKSATSGIGNIIFNGTSGTQTYTSGGTIGTGINLTVKTGAFLQMASDGTVVSGGGTFTLSSGATLGIKSQYGIAAAGTSGNIQTTGRVFSNGANYIYNLTGGAQDSGSGLPATAITGNVTITANVILTSTNPIIMNGTLTVNGTLLPGQENHVFSGSGTLTGTGRIKVTRTSATPEFLTQYTIANKQISNATIDYYATAGGQIVSPFTYGNLTMSNTSGTNTLGGAVNVSGTLTTTAGGTLLIPASAFLTSTNVTNNGTFTIAGQGKATIGTLTNPGTINLNSSSASSIYSLILDNYSGQGTVNMQMFVTGGTVGGDKWHYVAVPASGLPSSLFSDMSDDFMAYDDARVTTSEFNGWAYYDGWDGMPGIPAGGGFQTLLFGKGYNFYYDYDATVNFTGLNSLGTNLGSVNLKYSGPTSGLAIFGLNLLGNSLTCSLDWDKVSFNGPVNQAVYYTKDNKWATYMKGAGGLNGATNYIPPLQGFMVKATGTGASIDLSSARTHSSQAWYKKSAGSSDDLQTEDKPSMRIKLALNGAASSDETIVWGNDEATPDFDVNFDAVKLFSANVEDGQVYSVMGGINYAINGINIPADSATIPLAVKIVQEGSYSFIRKDLVVPDGFEVYLEDKDKNSLVKLNTTETYEFTSAAGTISNRFLLKFKAPAEDISTGIDNPGVTEKDFSVYASKGYVNILPLSSVINGQKGKVTLYDLSGRAVKQLSNVVWYEGGLIQIPSTYNGFMIVDFTSGARRFVEKIMIK